MIICINMYIYIYIYISSPALSAKQGSLIILVAFDLWPLLRYGHLLRVC